MLNSIMIILGVIVGAIIFAFAEGRLKISFKTKKEEPYEETKEESLSRQWANILAYTGSGKGGDRSAD